MEFLLGFEEGVGDGFMHWCSGNVGRGAHVEVVKGGYIIYVRVRVTGRLKIQNFGDEF